jgi:predicted membrane channel-forming protein YqfA (hemolysin III family)
MSRPTIVGSLVPVSLILGMILLGAKAEDEITEHRIQDDLAGSFKPGRFDTVGCSHQIFHILVVLATAVQLLGILSAFDDNYHHQTSAR